MFRSTKEEAAKGTMHYNLCRVSTFPSDEGPGLSAFYKDESGEIFHTYSTYARGGDMLINTYNYLDLAPKGRNEEGLAYPMAWVRHHDKYEGAGEWRVCVLRGRIAVKSA